MGLSKMFYRFLAVLFLAAFAQIPVSGYYDAMRAEREIDKKVLQQKLAVLEARNAPMKEKMMTKSKIAAILQRFESRLKNEPEEIAELLIEQSERYGLDPLLIIALIKTESDFRRNVVSSKGAVGLMQVLPFVGRALAKEVSVEYKNSRTLKNVVLNIKLGTHYIAKLRKRFGTMKLALVAYNRGPTRLSKQMGAGKIIRSAYAAKVMRHYDRFSSDFAAL